MRPIAFPQATHALGKPSDLTDEQCGPLPVCRVTDTDGFPAMISCWELSPEERRDVFLSGVIWLRVLGAGHPPVSLEAVSPFRPEEPEREPRQAPCICGNVHNLDEDGCCNSCGTDWNYELALWQAGYEAGGGPPQGRAT